MDTTLLARTKMWLRKIWETWSAIQDHEDAVWRGESEGISSDAKACATTVKTDHTPDLSELVKKRNTEYEKSHVPQSED